MSTTYGVKYGQFIKLEQTTFQNLREIKVCKNNKCKKYHKEAEGKFCSECSEKLILKNEEFEGSVISFLKKQAILNNIDPDSFSDEYSDNTIIFVDGMFKTMNDTFNIVSSDDINEMFSKENETFDILTYALKSWNIPFKKCTGFYNTIS